MKKVNQRQPQTQKTEYQPFEIELKWQAKWLKERIYQPDLTLAKKPFYNLMMFPYPSAEGLHVGNVFAQTGPDVYGRFMRMRGNDVFEPIGLDGFGIHSENYALKIGSHPMEQAKKSEENFYRQMHAIGNSFDWSRTVETWKPGYYRWTQWIFTELFKAGLAYRKKAPVNFCPSCKTVLSDEQVLTKSKANEEKLNEVTVGVCERCGTEVEKRDLEQWFFRTTNYADKLLHNLDHINWTEKVKTAQRAWIGKKDGAEIEFKIQNSKFKIKVFTTRPDTLFGAAFLVLSPEHPAVGEILQTISKGKEIDREKLEKYILLSKQKSSEERREEKEKTGVFTGLYAENPVNHELIPVWISDYVLMDFGTGAIMAVPGHDERDFEFAKKFNLPIKPVILPQREYVDENAKSYYEKRTNLHKEVLIDILKTAKKTGKKIAIWGGWAVAIQVGKQFRENEDLDLFIFEEDTDWWKERLKEKGFTISNMFPDDKNAKYYFQATKQDIYIDFITLRLKENGKFEWLSQAEPYEDKYTFKTVFELKEFETLPIWTMSRDMLCKQKRDVALKKGLNLRWNDKADFLMMGYEPYIGEGVIVNSEEWNGLFIPETLGKVIESLEGKGIGQRKTTYHLRDWLISRQRYWGPPIPMIYCENCAKQNKGWLSQQGLKTKDWNSAGWYPEENLPVTLPYIEDYKPLGTGRAPLDHYSSFYETKCPECHEMARRETDVSDTFLDSAWYFFRYTSTDIDSEVFDRERVKKWLPVNICIGGAEHAVLHLLYARFLTMVFHGLGLITFEEPFTRFYAHGLIIKEGAKMSKSKGNIVTPDLYIKKFGADALRTYLMFLGPFSEEGNFKDSGIEAMSRFLKRVWKLFETRNISYEISSSQKGILMQNETIKGVTEDIEALRFNTAIAKLMSWYNFLAKEDSINHEEAKTFLQLIAPFSPHIAEELWERLGEKFSIHTSVWPSFDEKALKKSTVTMAIQINGKLRGTLMTEVNELSNQKKIEELASIQEGVSRYLRKKTVKKIVYIPGKIINFVI